MTFTIAPAAPVSARSAARRCPSSAPAPARSTRTRPATAPTRPRRRCSSRSPCEPAAAGQHAVDHVHVDAARRRQRSAGPAYTVSASASSGLPVTLLDRRVERRRLHDLRLGCLLRRHRHVHDRREPGGQRELSGGAAGAAVVCRRAREPDDQLHVEPARRRHGRRPDLHRLGKRELGPRRDLLDRSRRAPASAPSRARSSRSRARAPAPSARTRPATGAIRRRRRHSSRSPSPIPRRRRACRRSRSPRPRRPEPLSAGRRTP